MIEWIFSIDPSYVHALLLFFGIAASVAVGVGIVMESPHLSLANILVVGGVAIEAVCTLLLFGYDEHISSAQQTQIAALEGTTRQALTDAKNASDNAALATKENTELERAVAPRFVDQGEIAVAPLRPFKGQIAFIIPTADGESRRFAGYLSGLLSGAKWEVCTLSASTENEGPSNGLRDAVHIEYLGGSQRDSSGAINFIKDKKDAANALVKELCRQKVNSSSDFVFALRNDWPSSIRSDALIIHVGPKPTTYFLEQQFPMLKEFKQRQQEFDKETQKDWNARYGSLNASLRPEERIKPPWEETSTECLR